MKMKTRTEKIARVESINRKDAKHYAKNCEFCLSNYESKKPLFLLETRHFTDSKYITFDIHIFTEENLNKKLSEFYKSSEVKKC